MEQNAGETDLSDRGGREKVGGSWLAEERSADDRQREMQNPAVFYKCLADSTSKLELVSSYIYLIISDPTLIITFSCLVSPDNSNELPMNTIWLKDTSTGNINSTSIELSETYLLGTFNRYIYDIV